MYAKRLNEVYNISEGMSTLCVYNMQVVAIGCTEFNSISVIGMVKCTISYIRKLITYFFTHTFETTCSLVMLSHIETLSNRDIIGIENYNKL